MTTEKKTKTCPAPCKNPGRAILKIAVIIACFIGVIGALVLSIDEAALNQIKFDLSLWSLIAIILIINIVSFATIVLLFFAYQWVRRDLKSPRVEDEADL